MKRIGIQSGLSVWFALQAGAGLAWGALSGATLYAEAPAAPSEILVDAPGAPVSIVVYSDYACPYSSKLYFTLEELEREFPDRLRVRMRQLPLAIHPQSPLAHEAAMAAAAQGKLAQMSELLFANQTALDRGALIAYASQLHLDAAAFRAALDSHAYLPVIADDRLEAQALGISSTPTTFLNGKRLDGAQSLEVLEKSVSAELAKADKNHAAPVRQSTSSDDDVSAALFAKLTNSAAEVRGAPNAPVTIVEFSDFQCPFCRQAVEPLEELLAARPGEVRLIFRSFPLDFHRFSRLAHEAALAAGAQGKFWQMHDLLFANQDKLERDDLIRYAAQLSLDLPAFENALDSHIYEGAIASDRTLGAQLDVAGTPTMFINGKRLGGARSLVELEQLVDEQARVARGEPAQQVVATAADEVTHLVVLGKADAPVRVAWFTDVRSQLAPQVAALVRDLDREYPGQLRVEFKTMQLANHADAELAGRALLAAEAQQKFWPMYDALAQSHVELDHDAIEQTAVNAGLDRTRFGAGMSDETVTTSIERDRAEEIRRAITGSPSIFIGDVRIDGLQPERVYKAAIDAALASRSAGQTASAGR